MMKINKREKLLLIILITLVILWGYNKYLLAYQKTSLEAMKTEKSQKELDFNVFNNHISSELRLDEAFVEIDNSIDEIKGNYFKNLQQEDIITLINSILKESQLTTNSISFFPIIKEDFGGTSLYTMNLTLSYLGSYSSLIDFIDRINSYDKKIILDSLGVTSTEEGLLTGNILLSFYGFQEIENPSLNWAFIGGNGDNPFMYNTNSDYNYPAIDLDSISIEMGASRVLLEDFKAGDSYRFASSHGSIKGSLSKSTNSKIGGEALSLEYSFPRREEASEAYIVFENHTVAIKEEPLSLRLWIYSYGNSNVAIKLKLKAANNEYYTVDFSNNINWVGWKQLSANMPQSSQLYPMVLDSIIIGAKAGGNDSGVILLDGLEGVYNTHSVVNPIIKTQENYIHYEVQPNDTLDTISMRFYNNLYGVSEIMRINSLKSKMDINAGKILIIPKP